MVPCVWHAEHVLPFLYTSHNPASSRPLLAGLRLHSVNCLTGSGYGISSIQELSELRCGAVHQALPPSQRAEEMLTRHYPLTADRGDTDYRRLPASSFCWSLWTMGSITGPRVVAVCDTSGWGVVAGLPILQISRYSTDISCFKILRAGFFKRSILRIFLQIYFFTFS